MRTTRANKVSGKEAVLLYRIIFRSQTVMLGVGLLLFSIFVQPVNFVYADETDGAASDSSAVAETVLEPAEEVVPEVVVEPESEVVDVEAPEESTPDVSVDVGAPEELDKSATTTAAEPIASEEKASSTEAESSVVTPTTTEAEPPVTSTSTKASSTDVVSNTATATPATEGGSSGGDENTGTSTDDAVVEIVETPTDQTEVTTPTPTTSADPELAIQNNESTEDEEDVAASSTPAATSTAPVVIVTNEINALNRYQFAESECVNVDDGAFYCTKTPTTHGALKDRIYAAADGDGDMEIFFTKNGATTQITHNQTDDLAPEYDDQSNTIVWHRLINGRYQIIQYNLESGAEYQLTSGSHNSMEPSVEGQYVVWQYWDEEDWEIVLYDGQAITQLTDNQAPDISPSIKNGYIIWSTVDSEGENAAMVYDIAVGTTDLIEGVEGGSVMNPRFVLVYDTKFANGDVVTTGYDPASGININLAALPAELPENIPDSEPTKEVRALIQNKSSKEDGEEIAVTPPSSGDPGPQPTTTAASSSPAVSDVDLTDTTTEPFTLTDYDVVVSDFATTSAQAEVSSSTNNLVE